MLYPKEEIYRKVSWHVTLILGTDFEALLL